MPRAVGEVGLNFKHPSRFYWRLWYARDAEKESSLDYSLKRWTRLAADARLSLIYLDLSCWNTRSVISLKFYLFILGEGRGFTFGDRLSEEFGDFTTISTVSSAFVSYSLTSSIDLTRRSGTEISSRWESKFEASYKFEYWLSIWDSILVSSFLELCCPNSLDYSRDRDLLSSLEL